MSESSVHIDPQQAANGLAQWEAGATALQSGWNDKIEAIRALNNAGTWGGDDPGTQFASQYADSAEQFADVGGQVVQQAVDLGTHSREAIENSLASDAEQAPEVTVEVDGLP